MATGTVGDQARLQPRQVINTFRKQINFGDAGNGVNQAMVVLPMGAFIARFMCEIVTAFDGTPIPLTLVAGQIETLLLVEDAAQNKTIVPLVDVQ